MNSTTTQHDPKTATVRKEAGTLMVGVDAPVYVRARHWDGDWCQHRTVVLAMPGGEFAICWRAQYKMMTVLPVESEGQVVDCRFRFERLPEFTDLDGPRQVTPRERRVFDTIVPVAQVAQVAAVAEPDPDA